MNITTCKNSDFAVGNDEDIISVYCNYEIKKQFNIFARYDAIRCADNWVGGRVQDAYYLGFEYQLVKYAELAPMLSYLKGDGEVGSPYVGLFLELRF